MVHLYLLLKLSINTGNNLEEISIQDMTMKELILKQLIKLWNIYNHNSNHGKYFFISLLQQREYADYADVFNYTDPIDKSVTKNQGLRFIFKDGSRIIYRLSGIIYHFNILIGTGSEGATIRIYFEKYENDPSKLFIDQTEALKSIIEIGLELS